MAIPQFTTDATIGALLANVLKQPSYAALTTAAAYWTGLVTVGHTQATNLIYETLGKKGYDSVLQIPFWDRGVEYETVLGVGKTLILGGGLDQVGKAFIEQYQDLEKILPATLLLINGKAQDPMNPQGNLNMGQLTQVLGRRLLPHGEGWHRDWGNWCD